MQWVKIAETSVDRTTTKISYALEIESLGCIVSTMIKSEGTITESSVFVPGVRIKDNDLVVIDGFAQFTPQSFDLDT